MRNVIRELRTRARERYLANTTFSDESSNACTPACRRDHLLEQRRISALRDLPFRF